MHNRFAHAGCDVSKDRLDVCCLQPDGHRRRQHFDNTPAGHEDLLDWLPKTEGQKQLIRFVLEATGTYSLDLALALHETNGVELMVAHPRAIKTFAGAQMRWAIS